MCEVIISKNIENRGRNRHTKKFKLNLPPSPLNVKPYRMICDVKAVKVCHTSTVHVNVPYNIGTILYNKLHPWLIHTCRSSFFCSFRKKRYLPVLFLFLLQKKVSFDCHLRPDLEMRRVLYILIPSNNIDNSLHSFNSNS